MITHAGRDPKIVWYAPGKHWVLAVYDHYEDKQRAHYGNYYASQLFSNPPEGRKIQIGWAQIAMPGMPFNQTFSFPHELTLCTTDDGIRMFAEPVKEIESLHKKKHTAQNKALSAHKSADLEVSGELFDVRATFAVGTASAVGLDVGGERVAYDVKENSLSGAHLDPIDGKVTIQVLVDRPMLEIIGNRGRVYITKPRDVKGDVSIVKAFAEGGQANLLNIEINEVESIWKQ